MTDADKADQRRLIREMVFCGTHGKHTFVYIGDKDNLEFAEQITYFSHAPSSYAVRRRIGRLAERALGVAK